MLAARRGTDPPAWSSWPPTHLVGPAPELVGNHPVWHAHLQRRELARALQAARADAVLVDPDAFPESLCAALARAAFACADAIPDGHPRDHVLGGHRRLLDAGRWERGPLALLALIAATHVHRAFWNETGATPGHRMRAEGFVADSRGEIAALDPEAEPWRADAQQRMRWRS